MCGNLDGDVDPRSLVTRLVDVFVVRRVMSFEGLDRDRIQVCRVCVDLDWVKIQEYHV